jgi:hypothetical protein
LKLLIAIGAGGAVAEVGLLPFARIAVQVCRAVLPRYRSRFSKHQFTRPQLLAILCLMRYEDWTFREAEVRLGEHHELCYALGLVSVPDFTTLFRFLQRLDGQTIDRAVGETVRRDAPRISATALPAAIPDQAHVQFGETQALGPCARSLAARAEAPSPVTRIGFQFVPSEASLTFLEDVNRAK